jgi:Mechanosensitive ion channel
VSIGASGTVSQAASGLMLMYTRAYRVGESVRIQDTEGTVVEVGLLSTRVRTGTGDEVMLPNTLVLGNTSRNYSRTVDGTGFVIDTTVTIGYDTPWRQVDAMLKEASRRVECIAETPPPRVIQTALGDFYVEYRLVAYSADARGGAEPAARQHPGRVQRVWRADHVAALRGRPLGRQGGAERPLVRRARLAGQGVKEPGRRVSRGRTRRWTEPAICMCFALAVTACMPTQDEAPQDHRCHVLQALIRRGPAIRSSQDRCGLISLQFVLRGSAGSRIQASQRHRAWTSRRANIQSRLGTPW